MLDGNNPVGRTTPRRVKSKPLAGVPVVIVVRNNGERRRIAKALTRAGGWVTECDRAEQGMANAQGGAALIIVDPDLPDFDGLELILQMKRHRHTAHAPLLHISAMPVAVGERVLGRDGADSYLTHPLIPGR